MTALLQLTFAGLSLGSVYALISLGWTVLFQVAKIYNLAQGAFVVVSALTYVYLTRDLGWPVLASIMGSLVVCLTLAAVLYAVILNPRATRGEVGPIVMSIGAALVIGEAVRSLWGVDPRIAESFLPTEPLHLFSATVLPHSLLLWSCTAVLFVFAWLVFERTLIGKALRACAESDTGAQVVGISPTRMHRLAFGLAGLFGGIGGIVLAPLVAVSWSQVIPLSVFGLIGAVIGRWRYLPAAVGSIGLGLLASYAGGFVSTTWQNSVVYGALLVALLVTRPQRPGDRRFKLPRLAREATTP